MKRIGKIIGFTLFALLWLVVLLLLPEVYERYRIVRIEKTNEWVLAYKGDQPWRDARPRTPDMNPYPDGTPLPDPKPATDPALDTDPTVSRFLMLGEEDRRLLADASERIYWLCGPDFAANAVYAPASMQTAAGKTVKAGPIQNVVSPNNAAKFADGFRKVQQEKKPVALDVPLVCFDFDKDLDRFVSIYPMPEGGSPENAFLLTASRSKDALRLALDPASRTSADDVMWRVPYQEYRPNMAVTPRFTTNNLGFRSRDVVVPKPEGVYRIACVGGSTTEEGFTNTTTYPAFLEVKLRKHFATDKIEVVNCGITGVDSLIERQRIFDYIAMQPDMIIEYNGVNDICHTIFPLLKDQSTLDRELLSLFRFYNARLNAHQLPPEQQLRKYIQDITIANLQAITRICKAKGVDIAFASFGCPDLSNLLPAERDYYDWNMRTYWQGSKITFKSYCGVLALYNDELKRMCETESAMFIPLAARLKGGTEYFGDICHMRQLGIEAKAEAVFQLIKDHVAKRTGLAGK